ncbi:hypothetical protein [Ekhidna sp.]|uniref:hypothetical protein n=1 Tax=Ekhidna sp. TaxID=2608089 RepID=UPI003CCBF674
MAVYIFYDNFFVPIDLDQIIDKVKDINNPEVKVSNPDSPSINGLLYQKVAPFIGLLYTSSALFGTIAGRFVRISGIDTWFKLFRFKNYWFYLFNGHHTSFKKMKHLKEAKTRHLFTKADVLIDTNHKTYLYSGIVVDYELRDNDNQALSKIMLHNAERYSMKDDKRVRVEIPGNLLVVDCSSMKNINLTYVNEETKSILDSKLPDKTQVVFGILTLMLLPFFIFPSDSLDWSIYKEYLNLGWFSKIMAYILTIQTLSLLNPFIKKGKKFHWVSLKTLAVKLGWMAVIALYFWFFH